MKSFSRIYPHTSHEQLESWNPSELDVELAVSPAGAQREQILAVFRNYEDGNEAKQEKGSHPVMHTMRADSVVTTWQPGEMNFPSLLVDDNEYFFIKPSNGSYGHPEPEIVEEEPNPEAEAVTILERARAQAEEIILEAQAAADQVIQDAQDEIDLEKKEGYRQGWNNARAENTETLKAAYAMVEAVGEWQTAFMAQGEQILVEMLKEISQRMFGEGVKLDPYALRINLDRIMESAQGLGDLNIFLNPRDAKLLDPSWGEYQLLISGNKVKIIPSEEITPGGCTVKGTTGTVDGRVETQLAAVMNTLAEAKGSNG